MRISACFAKEYGLHVDDIVMLRDPKKNMFEVQVEKKNEQIYIRNGWSDLRGFYKIDLGAWITLTFAEPNLMLMSIKNRFGVEIESLTTLL